MIDGLTASKREVHQEKRSGSLRWDSIMFLAISFLTLFARFRMPSLLLGSFQDDFFYYLKVARNIATTGVSTFNGLNLTNGYHPLWMAVLVVLCMLFRGTAFFVALQVVSLAAAAVTYWLLLRTLRILVPDRPARAGAFVLGMEALMLIRYGMEVTLTLPLALLLVHMLLRGGPSASFGRAAWLGFVASLLILSRLDAGLLVGLLCVAMLLPPLRTMRYPAALLGFACGVLPLLLLYVAGNLHYFHLLMPVSGLAKQMKQNHLPSPETWRSLLPADRMRTVVLLPELLLIASGALLLLRGARASAPPEGTLERRTIAVLLLFPLVHLAASSVMSDWPVWPWYFYSITLATLAAYVLIAQDYPSPWLVRFSAAYATVLVLYAAAYAVRGPNSTAILQSSMQVAHFMDDHPGVYLMGDQAGTTAYLSHQPIVQAEGLVMDRSFLLKMRAGEPLRQVAQDYHARYYVVLGHVYEGNCIHFAEPSNAGPESPKMRGTVCHAPVAVFERAADHAPIRIFDTAWIQ